MSIFFAFPDFIDIERTKELITREKFLFENSEHILYFALL